MFKKTTIDFRASGVLNPLVFDYLEKNRNLKPFYGYFPDRNGFAGLLKTNPYTGFRREVLSEILIDQGNSVKNTSESTVANFHQLKQKNTFTVTTGHQLCLFTGPLYFIYKIFSTINLAERLKREFPGLNFVPVYWMASEDHDFEEVNGFNSGGKTIRWKSGQTGAVGDFKTEELKKVFPEIVELFGRSENAGYLVSLFEHAYLNHKTLAEATRFLVNELFGAYGLVMVEGNDRRFKLQFREQFKTDIFDNSAFRSVTASVKELENLGYPTQVKPRAINCFYLENGLRARIEKTGETFSLVGTKRSFTKTELEDILEKYPERLSPNVVLRPVYQQAILPNIAYVGGPGELAYWLEYKKMFDAFDAQFPVLMPRSFVTVLNAPTKKKIDKVDFSVSDFFKPERELIRELQVKINAFVELDAEKKRISELYAQILEKAATADKTLEGSVSAELKRTLNGVDRISDKSNRALRRKSETAINQLRDIKQRLFPNSSPQERYENFSSLYLNYGRDFFKLLKENLDPFVLKQIVFTEE